MAKDVVTMKQAAERIFRFDRKCTSAVIWKDAMDALRRRKTHRVRCAESRKRQPARTGLHIFNHPGASRAKNSK
jgi:hypothetical protein